MNIDRAASLLRSLFQDSGGLREIDAEMRVPWTAAQWLMFAFMLITLLIAVVAIGRRFQRYLASRPPTFPTLLRQLDRIDQLRLRRGISHGDALVSIAEVLRGGLRLADHRRGGTGGYRTTGEWLAWSEHALPGDAARLAIARVLEPADGVKFSAAQVSLGDVRGATTAAKTLLQGLATASDSSGAAAGRRRSAA
jgi:hypothetical protein